MKTKILFGLALSMFLLAILVSGAQPPEEHMASAPVKQPTPFVCGDVTGDGIINSADIVRLIGYLFLNESPPDPLESADANGDTRVDCADLVAIWRHIVLDDSVYCDGSRPCDDRGERDSLSIQELWGSAGDTVDVPIFVFNDDSIFFVLCLSIPDPAKAVFLDTVRTQFTRLAEMDLQWRMRDTTAIQIWWWPSTDTDSPEWTEYLPP